MASMDKRRILIPLTIFSMFFGAGNLIFPPFLAIEAGEHFVPAFIGFAITAIGLPVIGLMAVERTDGLENLSSRIHPAFGRAFTIAIYLAIGPCLAIPRTASASFEMAAMAIGNDSRMLSILYSIVFFSVASAIAMKPEKLTKVLGRITCPLLLILIAILSIGCFSEGMGSVSFPAVLRYQNAPLATGLIDGYQTMDAIAALVFGIIVALNIRELGYSSKKECRHIEAIGGVLAGVMLLIADNGASVLSSAALHAFGRTGLVLLAAVFIAACLNTCIGLLSSCGEYFSKLFPEVGYRTLVIVFALFSAIVSNIGLNLIISLSSPVLSLLYPIAIVLIVSAFLPKPFTLWSTRIAVIAAATVSVMETAGMRVLPLSGTGFSWVLPAVIGALIGMLVKDSKCKDM